jgi:peptidoglycan biosynthesis protein MviN/MurJ (putative lipid II flippase)
MTAAAIQSMALGLWASSCYSMVMRAFIAKKDTVTPTLIGICSLVVYLLSALILMGPMAVTSGRVASVIVNVQKALLSLVPTISAQGHVGLALASSISAIFSLLFAITIYSIKLGNFPWKSFARAIATSAAATLLMIEAVSLTIPYEAHPFIASVSGVIVGALTYVVSALLLRSKEMSDTITVARRAIRRK